MWTEPDGADYALSFQEPEGCAEVWNFIQEVQRHMSTFGTSFIPLRRQSMNERRLGPGLSSSPTIGPEPSPMTAGIVRGDGLPNPALGIIPEIERTIKLICRNQTMKERLCEYMYNEVRSILQAPSFWLIKYT